MALGDLGRVKAVLSLVDEFSPTLADAGEAMEAASKNWQRRGRAMQRTGMNMTRSITAPILGAAAASFQLAVDAEENASKFDVVFGAAADRVRSSLEQMRDVIPETQSNLERLTSGLGDLLIPMGLSDEAAADMSVAFVDVAGDLAAFNNASPEVAIQKITSALLGSSEPISAFGVDTRVAALEAHALAAGLIEEGEQLDRTTRAYAVMLAIMNDSTKAHGAAAREADSNAAASKFLWAEIKQLATEIGTHVIPVFAPLIQQLRGLVQWFAGLSDSTKESIVRLGLIAAAVGPVLIVVGKLITAVATLTGASGLGGLATSISAAGGIKAALSGLGAALITPPLGVVVGVLALAAAVVTLLPKLREWWNTAKEGRQAANDLQDATYALYEEMKLVPTDEIAAWMEQQGEAERALAHTIATEQLAAGAIGVHKEKLEALEAATRPIVLRNGEVVHGFIQTATSAGEAGDAAGDLAGVGDELAGILASLKGGLDDAGGAAGETAGKLSEMEQRVRDLVEATGLSEAAARLMADEMDTNNQRMEDAAAAAELAAYRTDVLATNLGITRGEAEFLQKDFKDAEAAVDGWGRTVDEALDPVEQLADNLGISRGEAERLRKKMAETETALRDTAAAVADAEREFDELARIFGITNAEARLLPKSFTDAGDAVAVWGQQAKAAGEAAEAGAKAGITSWSNIGGHIATAINSLGEDGGIGAAIESFSRSMVSDIANKVGEMIGGPLGGAIAAGLNFLGQKVVGWIKGMFGPSAEEIAGREVAAAFRNNVGQMLNERQRLEAGNEKWKQEIVLIRDAMLALGRTEAEAIDLANRLWEAEKQGPEAVKAVIGEIETVLGQVDKEMQRTGLSLDELRHNAMNGIESVTAAAETAGKAVSDTAETAATETGKAVDTIAQQAADAAAKVAEASIAMLVDLVESGDASNEEIAEAARKMALDVQEHQRLAGEAGKKIVKDTGDDITRVTEATTDATRTMADDAAAAASEVTKHTAQEVADAAQKAAEAAVEHAAVVSLSTESTADDIEAANTKAVLAVQEAERLAHEATLAIAEETADGVEALTQETADQIETLGNNAIDKAEALGTAVGEAADKIAEKMQDAAATIDDTFRARQFDVTVNTSSDGDDGIPGFASGTGGFRDFGRETLVRLHGVERVQTPQQAAQTDGAVVDSIEALRLALLQELPGDIGRAVKHAAATASRRR